VKLPGYYKQEVKEREYSIVLTGKELWRRLKISEQESWYSDGPVILRVLNGRGNGIDCIVKYLEPENRQEHRNTPNEIRRGMITLMWRLDDEWDIYVDRGRFPVPEVFWEQTHALMLKIGACLVHEVMAEVFVIDPSYAQREESCI